MPYPVGMHIDNGTKLLNGGLEALAVDAAKLLGTHSVNLELHYRAKMRCDCRYFVRDHLGTLTVVLIVREQTRKKPYTDEFTLSIAASIRAGTAKLRHKRGARKVLWSALPPGVVLWKPLPPPAPPVSRRVKNAEKAKKALERCANEILETEKKLEKLRRRHKEWARRVRYYEKKGINEGPEFEAKLRELVKAKWGGVEPEEVPVSKPLPEIPDEPQSEQEAKWDALDYE